MKNRMKKQKDISDRKAIFIFVSISVIIFLFVFLNEMGVLFDENDIPEKTEVDNIYQEIDPTVSDAEVEELYQKCITGKGNEFSFRYFKGSGELYIYTTKNEYF